jgi:hypothetical protein
MRYAIEQRLRFIDAMLHLYGHVNREALIFFFCVSTPQASADLNDYLAIAPKNMAYNKSNKRYERTPEFVSYWG